MLNTKALLNIDPVNEVLLDCQPLSSVKEYTFLKCIITTVFN